MQTSCLLLVLTLAWSSVLQAAEDIQPRQIEPQRSHAFRPERRDATDERIAQLKLPPGFAINVFARDLGHARMIAVAEDGTVYLTCQDQGRVLKLQDKDGDGRAEVVETALSGLKDVHGITIHQKMMYLAAPEKIWVVPMKGEELGKPKLIIDDLPTGAQHPNRTLAVGPDEKLYITVGSTCNACEETNEENATVLRATLDGSSRTVFAKGLRNTIGFGWHPETGEMWGMDHGSDGLGNDLPPEELNRLQEGKDYGWPYVFGKRVIDPLMSPPKNMTKQEYAARTEPAVLTYQAHSSPIGFVFYTAGQFPEEYRNDAFVVFRGSWNRKPATGYKVARLKFKGGKPVEFEDFVTGFLIEDGTAHFGRLAGTALAKDGSLLVSEDTNGVMYRIAYK